VYAAAAVNYFVSRLTTDFIDATQFIDNTVNIISNFLSGPNERIAAVRSGETTTTTTTVS